MRPNPLDMAYAAYLAHHNLDALLTAVTAAAYRRARRKAQEDVAEDIAQRVALVAWRKIADYRPTGKFSCWVARITALEIAEHYRQADPAATPLTVAHDTAQEPRPTPLPELTRDEPVLLAFRRYICPYLPANENASRSFRMSCAANTNPCLE